VWEQVKESRAVWLCRRRNGREGALPVHVQGDKATAHVVRRSRAVTGVLAPHRTVSV
jgi:hypothetical protein